MEALRVERDGHVLRVILARPEQDAFDAALIAELTRVFSDVGDARAVVLAGDGASFCAGADVEWQRSSIDLSYDENVEDAMRLYRMLEAIDSCPAPVACSSTDMRSAAGRGSSPARTWPSPTPHRLRLPGGSPRDHSCGDLAVRPHKLGPAARRYFLTGEHFGRRRAPDRARARGLGRDRRRRSRASWTHSSLEDRKPSAGSCSFAIGPAGRDGTDRCCPPDERRGQDGLRAFLEKRPPGWATD